jgi:hypothetical protein
VASATVGQRYRTKVTAYLFTLSYGKTIYIGINDPQARFGAKTLPRTVAENQIGRTVRGATIIDVVPVGAVLQTKSVIRDVSGQGDVVYHLCRLEYGNKVVEIVSTYFIQSDINGEDGRMPVIDSSIAERLR